MLALNRVPKPVLAKVPFNAVTFVSKVPAVAETTATRITIPIYPHTSIMNWSCTKDS